LLINSPCHKTTKYINPVRVRVRLPNGDTMDSTHTASFDIPELSEADSVAHVFPAMETTPLISVGQLCNEGYYVTFNINGVKKINSEGKAILKGLRYVGTLLWRIYVHKDKPQIPIAEVNNVYELRNIVELVNYLHKALFRPTKSALVKAEKQGHLIN
jgi:hypothetical protein